MRVLVVGAGASYAESRALNAPKNLEMPLIRNFGRMLWDEFHPGKSLLDFLMSKGRKCDLNSACEEFFACEEVPSLRINIETYFEFFWNWRGLYQSPYGPDWWNVLYHGIYGPLQFRMLMVFHENESGWKAFPESDRVAGKLKPGDLILNLNYDTIFDIAAWRAFPSICYLPNDVKPGDVIVAKPHGSLNLLANEKGFSFGSPINTGALPPKGSGFHYGFLPPRLNKQYSQHNIAERIVRSIPPIKPDAVTYWGVGLTESDVELVQLFAGWAQMAARVEAINPSERDIDRMASIMNTTIVRFDSVDHWLAKGII